MAQRKKTENNVGKGVSLPPATWDLLDQMAEARRITRSQLIDHLVYREAQATGLVKFVISDTTAPLDTAPTAA